MNKVILMGRLTRNPEVRYSAGDSSMAIARYTLAVDRRFTRRGEDNNGATADAGSIGGAEVNRSVINLKLRV